MGLFYVKTLAYFYRTFFIGKVNKKSLFREQCFTRSTKLYVGIVRMNSKKRSCAVT